MKQTLPTIFVLLLATLLAACGGSAPTPAPPTPTTAASTQANTNAQPAAEGLRTFVLLPDQSKASYLVDEEFLGGALSKLGIKAGKVDVIGSTQAIEGQLQLNLADLAAALGENSFTVKLNTLTTDQSRRDGWIRENGPNFNQYPLATFKATAIEGAPASYTDGQEVSFQLAGDLTIREVTKPATFAVTATLAGDTLTGKASAQLKLSDFGIEPPNFANTLTVADEFGVEVQFTAKEQK